MNTRFYFHVFKELVKADLISFRENLLDKIINVSIWATTTLGIFAYIMPEFGIAKDFGIFQYAGIIASIGLFEMFPSAAKLINDFESEQTIMYNLTLPIPSWMVVLSKVVFYSINATVMAICIVPLGKLILLGQLNLFQISFFKLSLLIICASIFYASIIIWLAGMVDDISKIGNIWLRIIFPLWFLGGVQFSWSAMKKVAPNLAYLNLLNPMVYITEAARVAVIGQEGYLNFWLCICLNLIFQL